MLISTLPIFAQDLKYIEFKNNSNFTDTELYDVLGLQAPAWYEFYKDKRAKADAKIISSLQEILENFYKMEGFYKAKISKDEDNSSVVFVIKKQKGFYITSVSSDLKDNYHLLINQKKVIDFLLQNL